MQVWATQPPTHQPIPNNSYGLHIKKLVSCNLAYNHFSQNYDNLRCLEGVFRVSGGYLKGVLMVSAGQFKTGQVRTGHVLTGKVGTGQVATVQIGTG